MVATCRLNAHDLEAEPAELDRRRAAWLRPDPATPAAPWPSTPPLVGGADEGAVCG
jgi:hypothetical protein